VNTEQSAANPVAVPIEPQPTSSFPFDNYLRTEVGNGELFAAYYVPDIKYDHRRKQWLIWRGHWWSADDNGKIVLMAKNCMRDRLRAAIEIPDPAARNLAVEWALQSESSYRIKQTLELARSEKLVADSGADWNLDPWLLGVANGVVDLRTGKLRPGFHHDKITQHSPVQFNPDAKCPRWEQFVQEILSGNHELTHFVQKAVGYSLTAETSEQCLFLAHGGGANGKSTFLQTLLNAFGNYGDVLAFSALTRKRGDGIPNDLAALRDKRLAVAIEVNKGTRLNEAVIKSLTGCESITARFLYS